MVNTSNVGDVKLFTLHTLMEIIGKISVIREDHYEIENAFILTLREIPGENGEHPKLMANFNPLSLLIDKHKCGGSDIELYYSNLLRVSSLPDNLVADYSKLTGSILTPSKNIQVPSKR